MTQREGSIMQIDKNGLRSLGIGILALPAAEWLKLLSALLLQLEQRLRRSRRKRDPGWDFDEF